jgi:RNA polymerase sigma factor (sigma-70 family)
MTGPLRAYLMLRSPEGDWSVSVFRDLDTLIQAWVARPAPNEIVGVLHVGFDRPPSQRFEEVASRTKGRLLVTASAKYALPNGFESSRNPMGEVDGHPIYMGLRGWGYLADDDTPAEVLAPLAPRLEPQGWVKEFLQQQPDSLNELFDAGIVDDGTYLSNEAKLSRDGRYRTGLFRYRHLVRPNDADPCEVVRASPPWLLDRHLNTLDLTVRISNALGNMRIASVRDLLPYNEDRLLKIQNFGRKSIRHLHETLMAALNEGPFDIKTTVEEAKSDKLISEIERSLATLEEREREILSRRMGLHDLDETLQEIGDHYGVTRERIRQIESKSLERLARAALWDDLLITKLESLVLGREFPLPVLGLEAVDSWFEGVGKLGFALKYMLSNICHDRISVVRIEGIEYVGHLNQEQWSQTLREARRLLATGPEQNWSEERCKVLVEGLLNDARREFRGLLWRHASSLCHFAEANLGERVLASYGRGADQIVEAVLLDADTPLHYSEIADKARQRSGREIDIRRAHNAAASIGILLGRGVYGLNHHIRLSEKDRDAVRDEIELVILDGPDDRQWHTSELLSIVAETDAARSDLLDRYIVDALLASSQVVRRLGRMTWTKTISSSNSRIDVGQATVSVLQQAGCPLTTNEIRQRLIAVRGVSDNFQIHSSEFLVRLPHGYWGLNDRDICLNRPQQAELLEGLFTTLRRTEKGIHISEIEEVARGVTSSHEELAGETIFSLASCDRRFQINSAQYLFLREWGDARRLSVIVAVLETLRASSGSLSIEEIVAGTQRRIQRQCGKGAVRSCLQALDAHYDPDEQQWSPPLEEALDEVEPLEPTLEPANS